MAGGTAPKASKKGIFSSLIYIVLAVAVVCIILTGLIYGSKHVQPDHVLPAPAQLASADLPSSALAEATSATLVGDAVNKAISALKEGMKLEMLKLEEENKEVKSQLRAALAESERLKAENVQLQVTAHAPEPAHHALAAPSNHIAGVAMAILLHSPRWFQLRYTMMVNNVVASIPADWKVQIFYADHGGSQKGIDLNVGLQKLVDSGRLVLTVLPREMVDKYHSKRIQYMVDPWLWHQMLADRVLVFGGNSVVCGNSPRHISDFFGYDYVGSPWNSAKGGVGGDGGISLRNRKVMLEVLSYKLSTYPEAERPKAHLGWGMEDVFFVHTMLEMRARRPAEYAHIRLAPREVTQRWGAIGGYVEPTVLTASGTLGGVKVGKNRSDFIDYCLELKMLFPVLHDPGCFGAQVDKEQCAASICALSGKKSC
jgi:hypothetical protein